MDFTIPEEISQLCDGVRRFMDEHVYPLERHGHWKMEVGGPAYPPAIHYVINGHKWFASGAHGAAFAIVMARTNPAEPNPHRRFSQIIVPTDTPGFTIVRGIPVMGDDDNHHAEIRYDDCRVPVTNRLGGEGLGFVIAQERLGPGRIHHCMRWLGVARARLRTDVPLCHAARAVRQHVGAQGEHPGLDRRGPRRDPGGTPYDVACGVEDRHCRCAAAREENALIKFYGAGVLHRVVDKAIQVHGAAGVTEDHPLSLFYRQARLARIYDGPDEVHKMVVARRILAAYESVQ